MTQTNVVPVPGDQAAVHGGGQVQGAFAQFRPLAFAAALAGQAQWTAVTGQAAADPLQEPGVCRGAAVRPAAEGGVEGEDGVAGGPGGVDAGAHREAEQAAGEDLQQHGEREAAVLPEDDRRLGLVGIGGRYAVLVDEAAVGELGACTAGLPEHAHRRERGGHVCGCRAVEGGDGVGERVHAEHRGAAAGRRGLGPGSVRDDGDHAGVGDVLGDVGEDPVALGVERSHDPGPELPGPGDGQVGGEAGGERADLAVGVDHSQGPVLAHHLRGALPLGEVAALEAELRHPVRGLAAQFTGQVVLHDGDALGIGQARGAADAGHQIAQLLDRYPHYPPPWPAARAWWAWRWLIGGR